MVLTFALSALSAEEMHRTVAAFLEQALGSAIQDHSPQVRFEAIQMIEKKRLKAFLSELKRLTKEDPSPRVRKASARVIVAFRKKT